MTDGRALVQRWRASSARDTALAVFLAVLLVLGSYGEAHPQQPSDQVMNGHPTPLTPPAALLLVAAASLVLAGRRRHPHVVLTVSLACTVTFTLLGYVNGAALIAPVVGLYCLAAVRDLRRAIASAVVVLVTLMGSTALANPFGPTGGGIFLIPFEVAAALSLGVAVANHRAYVASLHARSEADARQRVKDERVRIARELHDVVAHTIATINVQAGVAAHLFDSRPEAAAQALTGIKGASKKALRELRAILDVLHQADDVGTGTPAPAATLDELDVLIAGTSRAGLPTTLVREGDPRPLPPVIELAAYRIAQESLTNALRYAGPAARATVALTYMPDTLRIEVRDDGQGPGATRGSGGTGHGLTGMRERAAAVGGILRHGPAPGGGFEVTAELPLPHTGGRPLPADVEVVA